MQVKGVRQGPRVAAVLVTLVCLLPTALAMESAGNLTVGSLSLPGGANSTLRFLGLIHNDAANLSGGDLQSDTLTFCAYEARFFEVASPDPILQVPTTVDVQEACFPLTNATLTISPDAGWIGLRSDTEGAANLTASQRATVTPESLSTLASIGGRIAGSDDNRKPRFHEVISGDHLLFETAGAVRYQGGGELRFMGPDAHVRAAENSTAYETGEETRGGTSNAHERIKRWIVIHFDAATVTLDATSTFLLAGRDAPRLAWDGNTTAVGVRGTLHAGEQEYAPSRQGASAYIDGDFTGSLTPAPGTNGKAATLNLEGDLRATSLRLTRAPVPASSGLPEWVGLLVVGAVLVSGGVAVVVAKRRGVRPATVIRRRLARQRAGPAPAARDAPAPTQP